MEWHWLDGMALYNKAFEKAHEQRTWEYYLVLVPNMGEKQIPYDEFYKKPKAFTEKPQPSDSKTKEEILDMVEKIRLAHEQSK